MNCPLTTWSLSLSITFGIFSHDLDDLNDFSYSISSNEILSVESEAGTISSTTALTRYEATSVDGQVTTISTTGDPNIALPKLAFLEMSSENRNS